KGDAARAEQITTEAGVYDQLRYTPDGRIVFTMSSSGSEHIWIMDADGGRRKQLTFGPSRNVSPSITPDGRYIVFSSNRNGAYDIWRMDSDGNNLKQLTSGGRDYNPECTLDGKWVVYFSSTGYWGIYKISLEGGASEQLVETRAFTVPVFSPDGKFIAYQY